jgi:hypothetical protein
MYSMGQSHHDFNLMEELAVLDKLYRERHMLTAAHWPPASPV